VPSGKLKEPCYVAACPEVFYLFWSSL